MTPVEANRALLRVLRDPGLAARLGRTGRATVLYEHDWDVLAQQTENVLQRAARPKQLLAAAR
jgi:glycosyltransferase involved in cell wall biosynthesis